MKIKYFDVQKQYQNIKGALDKSVLKILASGKYILGSHVENFEQDFARFCGARYGVGVGSGTDALIFALKSLGIGRGDEVVLPSFTFVATAFSVIHVGATPIFADVDPETYTLDPKHVTRVITKRTKALLPVHLYGQCAEMAPLKRIAKKRRLFLIEDAAQAHGARWKKSLAGSMGDVSCFSFYPTKNLGGCGDGGMILTKHKAVSDRVRRYRNLGRVDLGDHQEPAWSSRLDAIQASILQLKLKKLNQSNRGRRRVAARYNKGLKGTPLQLPREGKDRYHVYHLYVILAPGRTRDKLKRYLIKHGIRTMVHYPKPVHRYPAYRKNHKRQWHLPVTEKLSSQILSLPIYPEMPNTHVDTICSKIRNFYK